MNSSAGALRCCASSTMLRIRDIALSDDLRNTCMRTTLSCDITPAGISAPVSDRRGTLSPVSAAVLNIDGSESRTPSRGTLSPGRTSITSPGITSSEERSISLPFLSTVRAKSGRNSINDCMSCLALCSALWFIISPTV